MMEGGLNTHRKVSVQKHFWRMTADRAIRKRIQRFDLVNAGTGRGGEI